MAWDAELETDPDALYEVIGPDTRVRLQKTLAAPFRYICNLEYNGRSICTGALIGPRTVLTAGHCIAGRNPRRLRVVPGRHGRREPFGAARAETLLVPRDYRPVSPTDYGIIHLREPLGREIGYSGRVDCLTRVDPAGTSISAAPLPLRTGILHVHLAGYPGDKPGGRRYACRPSHRQRHPRCGTLPYGSFNRIVRLRQGLLHYLNDTFRGMSGSPVWMRRHPQRGGRVLIGIHIAGDDATLPGLANRAVRTNRRVLDFIRANTR